jgi:hypothetical protein
MKCYFIFFSLSLLSSILQAQEVRQTSPDTVIVKAFTECRNWARLGSHVFSSHWAPIVVDEQFQDRRISISVSNQFPLFMLVETTYIDGSDYNSDVTDRACTIRLADTSRPSFNWVNGSVSTADHWRSITALPSNLIMDQMTKIVDELIDDPLLVALGGRESPNATFASCTDNYVLFFQIMSQWPPAGYGGWQITSRYSSTPALEGSQVQIECG